MKTIKPAFSSNNVPICFSANDKYVPLLSVTIKSIIEKSKPENNYDICIFMSDINQENQEKLLSLTDSIANFKIRFVDVKEYISGYKFFIESDPTNTKFSNEIYYRVLVPAIMPEYNKVIFLDADILVLDDIAKLYNNYDITDYYLGAVRDYEGIANCYAKNYHRTKYRIQVLGITNFNNYFNSGVLLMNPSKFNKDFTAEALLDIAVSKDWKQFDQDVLNFLCKDATLIVDAKWNYLEDITGDYKRLPEELFDEFLESEDAPKIVHFAGRRKPWINIGSKYNKLFWKLAKQTPFLTELKNMLDE